MWSNIQAAVPLEDHRLRALADALPSLAGRASYSATYATWKRWAHDHDLIMTSLSLRSLFESFDGGR